MTEEEFWNRPVVTHPKGWTPELEEACRDSCAEFGDRPCQRVVPGCEPCPACLIACGIEPPAPPPNPDDVVRPLL